MRKMFPLLFSVLAAMLFVAAPGMATTIFYNDGTSLNVPADQKIVLVHKNTNVKLLSEVKAVKVYPQKARATTNPGETPTDCVPKGELVLGPSVPC